MNKLTRMLSRIALLAVFVSIASANPRPAEVPVDAPVTQVSQWEYEWTWPSGAATNIVQSQFLGSNGTGLSYYNVTVILMVDGNVISWDSYTMTAGTGGGGEMEH